MKRKLTLTIDEDVLQKTKKSGVNISQLVENFLKYGVYFRPALGARDPDSNSGRPTISLTFLLFILIVFKTSKK